MGTFSWVPVDPLSAVCIVDIKPGIALVLVELLNSTIYFSLLRARMAQMNIELMAFCILMRHTITTKNQQGDLYMQRASTSELQSTIASPSLSLHSMLFRNLNMLQKMLRSLHYPTLHRKKGAR